MQGAYRDLIIHDGDTSVLDWHKNINESLTNTRSLITGCSCVLWCCWRLFEPLFDPVCVRNILEK